MFTLSLTQAVGLLIAISLTVMLIMIGYQVIQILFEIKRTIEKANKILDDAGRVSESVSEPVAALSGFLTGLKGGGSLLKAMGGGKKKSPASEH